MTYAEMETEIERIEAEACCELKELSDRTPRERAQRLLDCDDPPRGDDLVFVRAIARGEQARTEVVGELCAHILREEKGGALLCVRCHKRY